MAGGHGRQLDSRKSPKFSLKGSKNGAKDTFYNSYYQIQEENDTFRKRFCKISFVM
jgi:hypothetical protein